MIPSARLPAPLVAADRRFPAGKFSGCLAAAALGYALGIPLERLGMGPYAAVLLAIWLAFAWHKGWSARSAASARTRNAMVRGGCLLVGAVVCAVRWTEFHERGLFPFVTDVLGVAFVQFAMSALVLWIFALRVNASERSSREGDADDALFTSAASWFLLPALLQSWVEFSDNFSILTSYQNPGWTVSARMAVAGYVGAAVAAGCAGHVRLRRLRRLTAMTRGADPEWEIVPGATYSAGSPLVVANDGPRDGGEPTRWTAFRRSAKSSGEDAHDAPDAQLSFLSDRADWLVRKRFYRARILMLTCAALAIAQAYCSSQAVMG